MPRPERHDVLIVGAGVAGLSAALWLRDFGLDALLLEEATQPGGQLHEIHAPIPNYLLGFGWDGRRFAGQALNDARAAALRILVGDPVTRVLARGRSVERRGGDRFAARAILIASGLRRRRLGVPGEEALLGRGVSHSANRDRERFAGKPVLVVGGGTAAVEDALLCAESGCDVTLLHRSSRFRARSDFLERARAHPKIRIVGNAVVTELVGEERLEAVRYRVRGGRGAGARGGGGVREAAVDAIFIRIGWEPRTERLRGVVRLDRAGYVKAGPGGVTSAPGFYAAGDVCSPRWPSIANAAGQGAAAAWEIARSLGRLKE
jgi:thioredoxin reductase (NADPH)